MLGILLAVVSIVIALVLFTPLELRLAFETGARGRQRVLLRWLFGLVSTEMVGSTPPRSVEPARAKKSTKRVRGRRRAHVLAMLRSRGFLKGALRLGIRLVRAFRFRRVFGRLRAGLDDPADTGLLCGLLLPAAAWLEASRPGTLEVVPDFSGEAFELALEAEVSVTPARLLGPVFLFGLSPSTLFGLVALGTGRPR